MKESTLWHKLCPLCHCSNEQTVLLTMLCAEMYECIYGDSMYCRVLYAAEFISVCFCVDLAVKTNLPLVQYSVNLNLKPLAVLCQPDTHTQLTVI